MIIEIIVMEYLKSKLDYPVMLEKQDQYDEYILIERTAGGLDNRVHSAQFAIQSHAMSMYRAACINDEVKKAMTELASVDCIGRCHLNSDYNFTDTAKKHYRYQAVYDLNYTE